MLAALSAAIGVPEPTLRLLVSVLAAYPTALVQRSLLKPEISPTQRNAFNVASGLAIAWFFCGSDIKHSLFTATVTYLLSWAAATVLAPRDRWYGAAAAFAFNFGYLLIAYVYTASEGYDINWTTPQSVLVLRLIGFAFDCSDGSKGVIARRSAPTATAPDADADDKKADAVPARRPETESTRVPSAWSGDLSQTEMPSYLEMLGFVYFSGSFLVGPQFSFALYRRYLTLDLFKTHTPVGSTGKPGTPIGKSITALLDSGRPAALKTFGIAVVYLAVTQVLGMWYWSGITQTAEFLDASFGRRLWLAWWAGKTALTKYLGVWLLTEGACIFSGLGFDGLDAAGNPRWAGLANIYPKSFELATSLAEIIGSFNVNTNHWAKLYVFKRLRFLGNKHLSSLGTLAFLCIWHGFHPGYIFAFSLEFVDMIVERKLVLLAAPLIAQVHAFGMVGQIAVSFVQWFLTTSALYYAALGFDLLTGKAILTAFSSLYWIGHILLAGLFVFTAVVRPPRSKADGAAKKLQ
ncbi:MBOAT, membrane-bound O-acyltransferase family-domain-containing protein [Blastocladiella britannica]|nr:MBOAT, membrane-bound O-acyltransferase family-domain-containing protein [Blastocladiella britannica]